MIRTIIKSFFIVSILSVLCSYNSRSQTQWTKYANNAVLTKGPEKWDNVAIGQPTCLFENDTIKMWYAGVGSDMKARICYAYSIDGIMWTKNPEPVMDVGEPGEWDRGWLDTPEIIKDESGYKLFYYGDTVWQFSAISSAMGLAYSDDGINWTREATNPVFTKGNPGDWDGTWVESPAVLYDHETGKYSMWYNGMDTNSWKVQIGLATSDDGINWSRYSGNPVITNGSSGSYDDIWLGTPAVLYKYDHYEMWYAATSSASYNPVLAKFDTVSICFAISYDGISWDKNTANPLFNTFTPPYDSLIDEGGPWAPDAIFDDNSNEYKMWYEAVGGLSLATAPNTNAAIDDQILSNKDLIVYPNPFENILNIRSSQSFNNASIMVFNPLGSCVFIKNEVNGNEIRLKIGGFTAGIYFIFIQEGNNFYKSTVIVK